MCVLSCGVFGPTVIVCLRLCLGWFGRGVDLCVSAVLWAVFLFSRLFAVIVRRPHPVI